LTETLYAVPRTAERCGGLVRAGIRFERFLPGNLFLTNNDRQFEYEQNERFVELKRIEEALKSKESRPADPDPEGHCDQAVGGTTVSTIRKAALHQRGIRRRFPAGKPPEYSSTS
jgi:hypothetical protein